MRPKILEIEGLQSFKAPQIIDFAQLGENGLFGIFGPTGSGKSTILDAITFALYGKVKRAERGTQGIINMDRQSARVAFTFELLKDGSRRTFRVERVYQRKKNAANSNVCEPKVVRLLELFDDGVIPLCDKATEVSNQIENLLGLNHEDFTRAVVLPQNSFQEFLLLDNSKKRAMLERIFYLEDYGKRLLEKIAHKLSRMKSQKDHLDGQMSAYQDATNKALAEARSERQQARQEKKQLDEQFAQMEKTYRESAVIWQLTRELADIQKRQNVLLQDQALMEQQKVQLAQAVKADQVFDRIQQVKRLKEKLTIAQTEATSLEKRLPESRQQLEEITTIWQLLKEESTTQQPALVERKTQLWAGLSMISEIDLLEKQYQATSDQWRQQSAQLKIQQEQQKNNEATKQQVSRQLKELEQQIQQNQVTPAYRQALQQGLEWENELNRQNKIAEDIKDLKLKYVNKLKELTGQQNKTLEQLAQADGQRITLAGAYQALENQLKAHTAYHLALSLEENQPCPVCGSQHHPQPAANSIFTESLEQEPGQDIEQDFEATRQKWQEAIDLVQTLEKGHLQQKAEISNWQERLKEQNEKEQKLLEQIKETKAELSQTLESVELQALNVKAALKQLSEQDQEVWDKQKLQAKLQKDMEQYNQAEQSFQVMVQQLEQALALTRAEGENLAKQKSELAAKLFTLSGGADIQLEIKKIEVKLAEYISLDKAYQEKRDGLQKTFDQLAKEFDLEQNKVKLYQESLQQEQEGLQVELNKLGFADVDQVEQAHLDQAAQSELHATLEIYDQASVKLNLEHKLIVEKLAGRHIDELAWQQIETDYQDLAAAQEAGLARSEAANSRYELTRTRHEKWQEIKGAHAEVAKQYELHDQIQKLLKGDRNKDNSFIDYIAEERMRYIAFNASEILGTMTQYKYGLEIDMQMGFMIRDNGNGGIVRSVSTLSGGEIFLTSLALALALSEQIQLKGQSPLEFFFLDEGFGTLDGELLDAVMDALEGLSCSSRMVGLISHVPEMRCRMERRLIVQPPTLQGEGSQVRIEKA
jgi:exonuclease SbcC